MKKSVELLKSTPSEKQIQVILGVYSDSKWLKKADDWVAWLSTPGWESVIELILFLDPALNRKIWKQHGYGWFYTADGEYGNYYSWEDPNFEPDDTCNYNELSDAALNSVINHSLKLKKIISLLNEE